MLVITNFKYKILNIQKDENILSSKLVILKYLSTLTVFKNFLYQLSHSFFKMLSLRTIQSYLELVFS